MPRTIATALLTVAAFAIIPAAAQQADLTLDQIVQKHTEALGGIEKLNAIQNVTMTGKASLLGGQIEVFKRGRCQCFWHRAEDHGLVVFR